MYVRTFETRDPHGNIVQVGVSVANDAWEGLCEAHIDVGPFDTVSTLLEALVARESQRAAAMMANDPTKRDPGDASPPLPFE